MVHGDDIVMEGKRRDLEDITKFLEPQYEVRKSMIGPHSDLTKQLKILNRTVGIDSRGYFMHADPRHGEILIRDLGLEEANACTTPEAGENKERIERESGEGEGSEEETKQFRGLAARLNYLSQDRP